MKEKRPLSKTMLKRSSKVSIPTFIACGGRGTRLGEQTKERQKCMLPYGGKPLLEHTLDWLASHDMPKPGLIASYRSEDLLPISQSVRNIIYESAPRGTAGCLHSVASLLKFIEADYFLYLLGDVFFDFDLGKLLRPLVQARYENPERAIRLLNNRSLPILCCSAVRITDHPEDSELVDLKSDPGKPYAHCGAFVLDSDILNSIPKDTPSDLTKDILPKIKHYVSYCPLEQNAFVRDTGTPEGQEKVRQYLASKHKAAA